MGTSRCMDHPLIDIGEVGLETEKHPKENTNSAYLDKATKPCNSKLRSHFCMKCVQPMFFFLICHVKKNGSWPRCS